MTVNLYALRDDKIGMFNPPVTGKTDASMIRSFGDLITRDKESLVGSHPEDFTLWFLGTFDDEKGDFSCPLQGQTILANGADFVNKPTV